MLRRFARADGLSTYLSDAYRGGMVMNFLLSASAVIAGVAYLPLVGVDWKWPLRPRRAAAAPRHRRDHRHRPQAALARPLAGDAPALPNISVMRPILQLLGVARPVARWPQGSGTQWPEYYTRQRLARGGPAEGRGDPGLSTFGAGEPA